MVDRSKWNADRPEVSKISLHEIDSLMRERRAEQAQHRLMEKVKETRQITHELAAKLLQEGIPTDTTFQFQPDQDAHTMPEDAWERISGWTFYKHERDRHKGLFDQRRIVDSSAATLVLGTDGQIYKITPNTAPQQFGYELHDEDLEAYIFGQNEEAGELSYRWATAIGRGIHAKRLGSEG